MSRRNRELTSYEVAIIGWILASDPGTVVIVADSDGPRPPGEYTMVEVTAYSDSGSIQKRVIDEAYLGKCRGEIKQESVGVVDVQTFGKTAGSRLGCLKMSYGLPSIREVLNASGLSIRSSTDSLNLSAIEGTRTVPRFSTSFQFGWALAIDYAADVIDTLEIQEI